MQSITITDILWLCGAITALVGVYKLVSKPYKDLSELTKNNSETIKHVQEQIKETKETDTILLKAFIAIINHDIDGNNIDGLKKMRNELTDFMSQK